MEPNGWVFEPSFADRSTELFDNRRISRTDQRKYSFADNGLAMGDTLVCRHPVQWSQSRERGNFLCLTLKLVQMSANNCQNRKRPRGLHTGFHQGFPTKGTRTSGGTLEY